VDKDGKCLWEKRRMEKARNTGRKGEWIDTPEGRWVRKNEGGSNMKVEISSEGRGMKKARDIGNRYLCNIS
jgi:hypothetical protein